MNSSDIHIERYEKDARSRIRIDGRLVDKYELDSSKYSYLINKIKIQSNLDISEKRLPQDGRMTLNTKGGVDIRVSILPTLHSEKVVLRILKKGLSSLDLNKVVNDTEILDKISHQLYKQEGIALISGPTGSGKTTTLYSMLKVINSADKNIITIEDPIEYTLEGINQVQVKEAIGLTFPSALRSVLRQDPDVIMVGEIRDEITAELAIRSALTGHLILSTIHSTSAWDAINRLVDMGVPNYLVSNTLNISIAQRLIRLLCPRCKVKKNVELSALPKAFRSKSNLKFHFVSLGCSECRNTGYRGRRAIMEIIVINSELRKEILKTPMLSAEEIRSKYEIDSLKSQVFKFFKRGEVSLEDAFPYLLES